MYQILHYFSEILPLSYIIGGVVGGVAVIFIIAIACVLYHRYKGSDNGELNTVKLYCWVLNWPFTASYHKFKVTVRASLTVTCLSAIIQGLSWSWLYGSWNYNYLCIWCLSPLKLWVWTLLRRGVQHYVIKFVSDLRQVGGFLQFPPPIKLATTI